MQDGLWWHPRENEQKQRAETEQEKASAHGNQLPKLRRSLRSRTDTNKNETASGENLSGEPQLGKPNEEQRQKFVNSPCATGTHTGYAD
jgi:hypothetical protein